MWTIITERTRLHWVGTASGLQIIKTEPLTQLFFASINTRQLPHIGIFHSPHLKAWKTKSKTSGQHLIITKMEKLAGMWTKEKLGDIPDPQEALPQKLLPQNCCLLYFPGHLLTSNNKFFSLAHSSLLSLRYLTCYSPGTYSSPTELQSALASHQKRCLKISASIQQSATLQSFIF